MKFKKFKSVVALLLMVSLLLVGCTGGNTGGKTGDGQKTIDYPTKAIDMTILFGAGSASDIIARKLAEIAAKELGQPIVANNRTGGGGAVGYQHVLSQKPDGYSIVWNSTSISTSYYLGNMPKDKGYDAFRGVACITKESAALAVRANAPWKTLEEFLDYAKANPGKVTVANSGVGSFNHLVAAAIEDATGVKFKHVPLDAKQSMTSLLGGQVDAMVNMTFDIVQQEKAGQIRTLAVVSDNRHPLLPNTPTFKEKGYDVDFIMYRGIAVHKDTPDEIVKILEDAFIKAANSKDFQDFITQYGVEPNIMGAEEFDKFMAEQDKLVADLMEKVGMKKQ